jgi:hypothetical protein
MVEIQLIPPTKPNFFIVYVVLTVFKTTPGIERKFSPFHYFNSTFLSTLRRKNLFSTKWA